MRSRWTILAVLFVARTAMAFQFQSIAAVAPLVGDSLGASLADIGILIGLYLAPGVALALPGATIGQRHGDKSTVLAGLLMMLAGEMLTTASTSWSLQIGGRLIGGTGGVLLNVLMTKMVADWFAGREIATAMAIYINSWPAGIAIALMLLPAIGTTFGMAAVGLAVSVLIMVGIGLMAFVYRAPEASHAGRIARLAISAGTSYALVTAGLIWCLYNVGFAMVFSFGPEMLVDRGWSNAAAGSAISVVLWLAMLSVPLGGLLVDRTRRGGAILTLGCAGFAMLMLLLSRNGPLLPLIIATGIVCGLPAGAIMSLPTRVLDQRTRSIGMGVFYTVYYAGMLAAPAIGGRLAVWAGTATAALDLGAAALLICPFLLWPFHRFTRLSQAMVDPIG
ncbi:MULTISPECIES: MFS transporter [unclassified Mesorhizobium]|uniref:MFS transporter n=1 Tax=Mesorhizobium TaxID=68287 RepID=UPI000FCA100F|nr:MULTISPECIES: MFS transporter [unclassified Mesorhizobium]RUW77391.1 MFS transporter [Mesorhizobium sp. M4B.F.Ca.ET.049.02.1.2]TGV25128.1 MFS transporter [Mesorhizobium sp. M4B.F.Ca.ET.143.01.1.1]RUW28343.1 MFS transporter [Mesorhizobium sp. M4B.F.Ca.ET.013.02.1.1]RVD30259.1 MFS transporter [Mesorhizobium sp. M4B.F.Ca.ET.017.02.2.1]RVD43648.1 MFS transporter [Mesorhizobium sp. M4B.F.Ca.ET.019.03.1.1]